MDREKIYCAGPLFNPKEREEMAEIAKCLQNGGYRVFLPHKDGIELAALSQALLDSGCSVKDANELLSKAVFHIDAFHVADSDGLVLNLNGRVPDEGAMVEAGIAWALGKPVVIYKSDARSVLLGVDNPLVLGLSMFRVVTEVSAIVKMFDQLFTNDYQRGRIDSAERRNQTYEYGERLYRILSQRADRNTNIDTLLKALSE